MASTASLEKSRVCEHAAWYKFRGSSKDRATKAENRALRSFGQKRLDPVVLHSHSSDSSAPSSVPLFAAEQHFDWEVAESQPILAGAQRCL